jgi:predicted ABC-type ATPase
MAIERVSGRVKHGGHSVPDETIRRRYLGGLKNFFELYRPLTETWTLYDNSSKSGPRLVAFGGGRIVESIRDSVAWNRVQEEAER